MVFTPGDALGASYRLVKKIGEGAVGAVWLVESTLSGERLAAKFLKPEHSEDPATVERFIRERTVLLGLKHKNIVAVRDLVVEGSHIAIIMNYVPGGSLRDVLREQKNLPPAVALHVIAQVFEALVHAHKHNVTHRDIKPDNVLLLKPWNPTLDITAQDFATLDRAVQVGDFGIASALKPQSHVTAGLLGTPEYMAPEVISTGTLMHAGDIYSAGILLYELLAGRTPYAGAGTEFTIAYRHTIYEPPSLDLPEPLTQWLGTLLSKDPQQRPTAAQAHQKALRFATQYAGVAPLEPVSTPAEYISGTETVLRGMMPEQREVVPGGIDPSYTDEPDLGTADQTTLLRPHTQPTSLDETNQPATSQLPTSQPANQPPRLRPRGRRARRRRGNRALPLVGAALLVILGGVSIGISIHEGMLFTRHTIEPVSPNIIATQQDLVLPTGLMTTREAIFDPDTENLEVRYTYSAQKAELSGTFLEIVPGVEQEGEQASCENPTWKGVEAQKHQASSGINAACGWKLEGITIPENGQITFSANLSGHHFASEKFSAENLTSAEVEEELESWLDAAASATATALNNREANSTAYPVQRLQDLQLVVPARTVSQTVLPISIIPVWPNGPDELNPVYQSPTTGSPTQLLSSISGNSAQLRFSDSCGGAVAVASDGLSVTTLTPAAECTIHATVGNFTSLESEPFRITTR